MILGFDIETTPFEVGKQPLFRLWTLWSEEYKDWGYTPTSFMRSIGYMWDTIDEIREDVIIVAHNLMFDFTQTIYENPLPKCRSYIVSMLERPAFAKFGKRVGNKVFYLYFVDLANYLTGSLKRIAEDLKLSRKMGKENIYTQDIQQLKEYCFRDSQICFEALTAINPFFDGRFKITRSSLAYADIKERSQWKFFPRPHFVREAERASYFGGRCHPNRDLKEEFNFYNEYIPAYKYDIVSEYPAVMYNMKVPTRYIGKLTRHNEGYKDSNVRDLLKTIYYSDHLQAIVKCRVTLFEDCLPYYNDEGKLSFEWDDEFGRPKSKLGTWCIDELYPAVLDGGVFLEVVASIYLYEAEKGMFNAFIDHWFEVKMKNSKGVKGASPILREYAKLMLNGAYGKFGERLRINYKPEDIFKMENEFGVEVTDTFMLEYLTVKKWALFDTKYMGEAIQVQVQGGMISAQKLLDEDARGAVCVVASIVTARARRMLWEGLRNNQWLYCDTDSMIVTHKPDVDLGEELGQWTLEMCSNNSQACSYMIKGRKDYRCKHDIKMKGVPMYELCQCEAPCTDNRQIVDNHLVLNDESYQVGVFYYFRTIKPKEALRRGLPPYSVIKMEKKRHY